MEDLIVPHQNSRTDIAAWAKGCFRSAAIPLADTFFPAALTLLLFDAPSLSAYFSRILPTGHFIPDCRH